MNMRRGEQAGLIGSFWLSSEEAAGFLVQLCLASTAEAGWRVVREARDYADSSAASLAALICLEGSGCAGCTSANTPGCPFGK